MRAAAVLCVLALASPCRGADCAPEDDACHLALGLEACKTLKTEAETVSARLEGDLKACEARTCPPPAVPSVAPWLVAAGAVGLVAGVLVGVVVAR